jgi:N-acyl-D-amino-acid deacylase
MLFDLLIQNGRLVEGAGNPWYRADIGIQGERIAAIGRLDGAQAACVLNAEGWVIAPGFIDVHCHSEMSLLREPRHEGRLRQGITTELLGQDGVSYAPVSAGNRQYWADYMLGLDGLPVADWQGPTVSDFLARYDRRVSSNVAYLIPHGNVRYEVMGGAQRRPDADELRRMQQMIAQGMTEGAVGLSTGLIYEPCLYADTEELIALCRPVAEAGGVFVTHMRDYVERIIPAMEETFRIGREAGLPVHISHFNTTKEGGLPLIDRAREEGVEVTFDIYPYRAGCTILAALLPAWVQAGGVEFALPRLRQAESRAWLRDYLATTPDKWTHFTIAAVNLPENKRFEGLTLPQAAEAAGKALADFVVDILIAERLAVTVVAHQTHRREEDLETTMRHPCQMFCTDGILLGSAPHPRGYGTYPRILGRYVRERRVLSLEEAVRKMTSLPAQHIGLRDRGLLREGYAADIVCFDPQTVLDRATYEQGTLPPEGIEIVLVNGEIVVEHGQHTGALPGRALRRGS